MVVVNIIQLLKIKYSGNLIYFALKEDIFNLHEHFNF